MCVFRRAPLTQPTLSPSPQASGFGPLGPGIILHVPPSYARALAGPTPPPALAAAGAAAAFEIAAGANGRVWVGGGDPAAVVAAAAAISAGEFAGEEEAARIAADAASRVKAAG